MKRLIIFLSIIFSAAFVFAQQGKEIVTETYKVDGNCNMCKKRIENASYIKGVKRADWDKDTHILTLVYNKQKTTAEDVLKSIAKAGHSSEKATAAEADYEKLPKCCHYKTEACEH